MGRKSNDQKLHEKVIQSESVIEKPIILDPPAQRQAGPKLFEIHGCDIRLDGQLYREGARVALSSVPTNIARYLKEVPGGGK